MKDFLVGGKVTSLDLSRDETKLAVCSRDDKIQVSVLITKLSSSGSLNLNSGLLLGSL